MINTDMFVVRYIQICLSFVTYRYVCRSSHRYVRCVMWTFFSVIWQCVLLQFTHVDCRFLLGCCVTITSHSQVGTCIIFLCALVCTCSFIEVYRLCLHGYFIFSIRCLRDIPTNYYGICCRFSGLQFCWKDQM